MSGSGGLGVGQTWFADICVYDLGQVIHPISFSFLICERVCIMSVTDLTEWLGDSGRTIKFESRCAVGAP